MAAANHVAAARHILDTDLAFKRRAIQAIEAC